MAKKVKIPSSKKQPKVPKATQTGGSSNNTGAKPKLSKDDRKKIQRQKRDASLLNKLRTHEGDRHQLKAGVSAFKTGASNAVGHFSNKDNLKRAGIKTLHSSVISATAHGGLAAIQGEDPWEAAKTGFARGAIAGGGYQFAKQATGAQSKLKGVRGIMDNGKQIVSGGRDLYRAHTATGNAAMRRDGVSPQLKTVLRQQQRTEMTGGIFGLK